MTSHLSCRGNWNRWGDACGEEEVHVCLCILVIEMTAMFHGQ